MDERRMANSLLSGLAGAVALNLTHETARHFIRDAPRMDLAGRRALARGATAMGWTPPRGQPLQEMALAGDILSNSLYYTLVGLAGRRSAWATGLALGMLAGIGAVQLTPRLGLGSRPSNKTSRTKALTVAWYTLGGLAAAATYACLDSLAEE